jgi:hypothetical protein
VPEAMVSHFRLGSYLTQTQCSMAGSQRSDLPMNATID